MKRKLSAISKLTSAPAVVPASIAVSLIVMATPVVCGGEGVSSRQPGGISPALHSTQEMALGLKFSTPEMLRSYPPAMIARGVTFPTRFVLDDFMPPVMDQGDTYSCVAWSAAYYCFTYGVARRYHWNKSLRMSNRHRFSPSFVWHQYNHGQRNEGMYIPQAMSVLRDQGCASLQEMPWDPSDVRSEPSKAARLDAAKYRAHGAELILCQRYPGKQLDLDPLKSWLYTRKQPLVIGLSVLDDFGRFKGNHNAVYAPSREAKLLGPHALCVVGYDDRLHAFRVVNSLGAKWGDHGYAWLSDNYLSARISEAWGEMPGL